MLEEKGVVMDFFLRIREISDPKQVIDKENQTRKFCSPGCRQIQALPLALCRS